MSVRFLLLLLLESGLMTLFCSLRYRLMLGMSMNMSLSSLLIVKSSSCVMTCDRLDFTDCTNQTLVRFTGSTICKQVV